MTPAQIAKIMVLVDNLVQVVAQGIPYGPAYVAIEAALRDAPQQAEPTDAAQLRRAVDALHWIKALAGNPEAVWRKANETIVSMSIPSAPTAVEPDERAEFDAWYSKAYTRGQHAHLPVNQMWVAWQARAAKGTPL